MASLDWRPLGVHPRGDSGAIRHKLRFVHSVDKPAPPYIPEITTDETGTLGRAIRAKVPIYRDDQVIGVATVGILGRSAEDLLQSYWAQIGAVSLGALVVGGWISWLLASHVRREIFGLEPRQIATRLEQRDAMLRCIREGAIAIDREGVVDVVNDEACRLLNLQNGAAGRSIRDVDVIMVTAAKDMPSLQQAMQGGVLHYIVKPFDFARFARTLETYRRFREERARREVVAQADVDRLFRLMAPATGEIPKGLNRRTLDLILCYLVRQHAPQTAQEEANRTGVSRGTARRYLEYLEQRGQARLDLRYGSTGRPEHLYELVGEQTSTRRPCG